MNDKQRKKIETVLKEFSDGRLITSSGDRVKSKDQALAIAFNEAGIKDFDEKKAAEQRLFLESFGMWMTAIQYILTVIFTIQTIAIVFYVVFFYKFMTKDEPNIPIKNKVMQAIGIKSKAWVPHKDEGRILDGKDESPYFD